MDAQTKPEESARAEVREQAAGEISVVLRGCLGLENTAGCWRHLQKELGKRHVTSLEIDASQLTFRGGIGITLLHYLSAGGMTPGAKISLHGLSEEMRNLMHLLATDQAVKPPPETPLMSRVPEETGAAVRAWVIDLREQVAFIGGLLAALPAAIVNPKRMRWREVGRVMERAGADALPVVAMFSWLVGLVMALEAAAPLRQLGAQIFIADMIGFSSLRDTGPLVTAIMLAGRSGSAFAAELGTMKVNQELDALTTMGLEPMRFLVLQRVVAAVLLTPLLTVFSMLMALFGGIVVMRFLGFPPLLIYHQIVARVGVKDLMLGLEKSLIFGLIIGGMGCLRGLQTEQGPRAVGLSTTRSVVSSILLVILANTLFSAVQYFLNS